ncbi:hypothetical protein JHW43_002089 [Diplocarpon mali]|nr:hypothetical protein JHW43_002089 [Diplocarpon mali]
MDEVRQTWTWLSTSSTMFLVLGLACSRARGERDDLVPREALSRDRLVVPVFISGNIYMFLEYVPRRSQDNRPSTSLPRFLSYTIRAANLAVGCEDSLLGRTASSAYCTALYSSLLFSSRPNSSHLNSTRLLPSSHRLFILTIRPAWPSETRALNVLHDDEHGVFVVRCSGALRDITRPCGVETPGEPHEAGTQGGWVAGKEAEAHPQAVSLRGSPAWHPHATLHSLSAGHPSAAANPRGRAENVLRPSLPAIELTWPSRASAMVKGSINQYKMASGGSRTGVSTGNNPLVATSRAGQDTNRFPPRVRVRVRIQTQNREHTSACLALPKQLVAARWSVYSLRSSRETTQTPKRTRTKRRS